jgi:hypothetical protein
MDFKQELAKYGYNSGNSIDVDVLINEILPKIFNNSKSTDLKQKILHELWAFCEKEFGANFEVDWINGYGSKSGMSDRTEKFAEKLSKHFIKRNNRLCNT